MPLKVLLGYGGQKIQFYVKKYGYKKITFSEKSYQVLSFSKMKSIQAHEIGGLALQKETNRKKMLTTVRKGVIIWYEC